MSTRQSQPEPMERYLAKLKDIRDRAGLVRLKDLEDAGIGSRSTLSRIFRGEKRAHDDVLEALCRSARAMPVELGLLKNLRDDAFSVHVPTSSTTSVSDRTYRRARRRWIFVAGAAVSGLAAGVVLLVAQPGDSSPEGCVKYEVTSKGNVVNDAGKDIGDVFPEDVFVVDRSPRHPELQYRYHGTVVGREVSGHVLQKKLNPIGPCT